MSVLSITEGDLFTIRTFKSHVNNPDRVWANNYEFRAKAAADESDLAGLLVTMHTFEMAFHFSVVHFIRVSGSTWEPDSVPYDPAAFISIPINFLGVRTETDVDVAALNTTMRVNRIPASGRFGNLFYRGAINENDISAPAGKNVIAGDSDAFAALAGAIGAGDLVDILGGSHSTWEMVMVNADATQVRRVVGLLIGGVSTVPMDHTWFNRSSITVP